MNQDIIEYLEGYWEEYKLKSVYFFEKTSNSGIITFFPESNSLYIGEEGYGYEVQIQDLQHLIQLEALL
tara:strand:- start:117336 stop:117542 length:207 start_codon:yes stop_codon:yes gene_type:complete